MTYPILYLKKREEQRLLAGHVWIYSNEVDTQRSPLASFTAGQTVNIGRADGKLIGTAYVNPHSLICARLLSEIPDTKVDTAFFVKRISSALRLRQSLFDKPFYRLVHAEGDALPGLIIDRYGDVCVVQCNTAGMAVNETSIIDALNQLIKPRAIVFRNDSSSRTQEGLAEENRIIGDANLDDVLIEENATQFSVPLMSGQKTGWFYDHRYNRRRAFAYVRDKTVLDVFCYLGGWAIEAAQHGAASVTAVDASQTAIDGVRKNAELNGLQAKVETQCGDAFDVLQLLKEQNRKFDVVIVDPPAFIKRKKDFDAGFSAYMRVNTLALSLLSENGVLISSSCSYHLSHDDLRQTLLKASRKARRPIQLIEQGAQSPDHPVHPAIPETAYIKSLIARCMD